MRELAVGKYIEKKSLFYAHLYEIDNQSEIEQILKDHRTLYKKASHHCYALVLSTKKSNVIKKSYDDREVGHPGKILLEILKYYQFDHHLLVVSRIFGGVKLGIGGVSKAFRQAATSTIRYYNDHN